MFKLFGKSKPTTPKVIEMTSLMRMARELEDVADDGEVTAQAVEELAAELETPVEDLYAGLGSSMQTTLALEHDLQFVVCTGGCQARGALSCVESLLAIRTERLNAGKDGFDVVPRQCLNRCANAPVVEIRSKDGGAVLTAATPKSVADAVKELLE
jgi:NADH:ubiquinone oxidoreductase subunit E